jgi:hypothetical protein
MDLYGVSMRKGETPDAISRQGDLCIHVCITVPEKLRNYNHVYAYIIIYIYIHIYTYVI